MMAEIVSTLNFLFFNVYDFYFALFGSVHKCKGLIFCYVKSMLTITFFARL
jgi:hypothetical protein